LSFGIHEVDEEHLECDPTTIDGQEFPINSIERTGVNVIGKESADFAEDLLDSDAASSGRIWEQLDEIR
jgi:hypothetical protein